MSCSLRDSAVAFYLVSLPSFFFFLALFRLYYRYKPAIHAWTGLCSRSRGCAAYIWISVLAGRLLPESVHIACNPYRGRGLAAGQSPPLSSIFIIFGLPMGNCPRLGSSYSPNKGGLAASWLRRAIGCALPPSSVSLIFLHSVSLSSISQLKVGK